MPLPPKGLALAPQTQKSSKTIQNHKTSVISLSHSVSWYSCFIGLFGNLDAEELRQTPSHCRAHGTRRGWRRRWQPQADGPQRCWDTEWHQNRFFHTHINAICNMIYTYIHAYTCKSHIHTHIYIYVMCVCTTCISKYIEILQITAATATLCLWDSETFNFLLCFSPFMSMSSWCCKVLGWSSTWGCCGRGPCGPRGPCRGRTQLFLAPDVQFLWQHLSLCRYTMQDHTIQYHTTIQHHNGFN